MTDTYILIITSIVTSIVAAIIFWLLFNYLPEKLRYNKIRPKLEYDIYDINSSLFQFIQITLKHTTHSPPFKQEKIFAGNMKAEDFELLLQNKCLNESYQFDEMASYLIPIGQELERISLSICQKAEHLYIFNQYLSANEILLIRKITVKVRTYSYTDTASIVMGTQTIMPVNPTISYMATNFYDLYLLFLQLQEMVLSFSRIAPSIRNTIITDVTIRRIMNSYYRKNYKKCLKMIKKSPEEKVWGYKFLSLFHIGKQRQSIEYLKDRLTVESLKLIYLRGYFKDIYKDACIREILIQIRSENEYMKMTECIEKEQKICEQTINQAIAIRKHYRDKETNQKQV